jgi:hypothetical protein
MLVSATKIKASWRYEHDEATSARWTEPRWIQLAQTSIALRDGAPAASAVSVTYHVLERHDILL